MGLFLVSTRSGGAPVEVEAPNWLVALGVGLDQLGSVTSIDRLACEVLQNGKVIARDVRTGTGFVVQAADSATDTVAEAAPADPDEEETLIPAPADDELPIAAFEDDEDDDTFSLGDDEEMLALGADAEDEDETFSMPPGADELIETLGAEEDEDDSEAPYEEEDASSVTVAWDAEAPFFAVDAGGDDDGWVDALRRQTQIPAELPEPVVMPEAYAEEPTVPDEETCELLEALPDAEEDEELWAFPFRDEPTVDDLGDADDPALAAVLETISGSETVDAAWKAALIGAQSLVPCESGAALRQEWDGTLRFIAALGPQAHKVLGERVPAGLGIVGFCVQRRVSLLIRDPKRDPRFFANMDRRTGYHTACVLAVPVLYEATTFGCLELLNAPRGFSRQDLERLVSIADELAEQLLVAV